jgi:hypothetical protein
MSHFLFACIYGDIAWLGDFTIFAGNTLLSEQNSWGNFVGHSF